MSSHAQDASTYESIHWISAPPFPYHEAPSTCVVTSQSTEQPRTDAQDHSLYQVVNLAPSPNTTQQIPIVPQKSTTQHTSMPQQSFVSLENPHLTIEHSDPSRENVAKQTSWPLEPNKDDWERHRSQIADLYQSNTLEKVMEIMKREHGIKASTKMYKDRINKWKIDKKIKGEEMKAIIRKQTQRSRAGKKSVFRIRNSHVSELKIVRYRKAMKLSSEEQALRLRAPTPPELICYTPLASPLTTPRVLETPERIVKVIQEFSDGSFDSKAWLITEDHSRIISKNSSEPIYIFRSMCSNVRTLFLKGETKNALRVLNMAMALIEQMVSAECPNSLGTVAAVVLDFRILHESPGIAFALLKQFSAMSAAILPQRHPFNQIFALLVELNTSHLEHTLSISQQSQADFFTRRSGRFNWITLDLQLLKLSSESNVKAAQTTERYSTLLRECEHALGSSDPRSLKVRIDLGWHYMIQGEYKEAAKIARTTIALAAQSQDTVLGLISDAFYVLSVAQSRLSETDLAEQNIRKAINVRAVEYGWENERVLYLISALESRLKEWNRPGEAAEVHRTRNAILESKIERLNREEEERYRRCQMSQV